MYRSTEPYFTGHQFDGSLNIYYADHRFYDAETGTWLSPDPVKDGLNWYQYCGNNPVTYVDLIGLWAQLETSSTQEQYKPPQFIKDPQRNPYGIPMYTPLPIGQSMNLPAMYVDLTSFPQAKGENLTFTVDSTAKEQNLYSYVHPYKGDGPKENILQNYNAGYHGSYSVNGEVFSLADNRVEIAVRYALSTGSFEFNQDKFNATLAGTYMDIVLADGAIVPAILGGSKGNEPGSDSYGVVHHDGKNIFEFLAEGTSEESYPNGVINPPSDLFGGQDVVGVYVYKDIRLYDFTTEEYCYYFSESLKK